MASEIRVNKIANRAGLSTVEYTDTGIIVSGIVTCTEISGLNALNIAGVSTFASPLDINGDIDVDGHTNLDNLSVAGVSTFSSNITLNGGLVASSTVSAGQILVGSGVTIEANQVATGQATFTGIVTASAFKLPDGSNAGNDLTSVTTNIVPDSDNARDLGTSSARWNELYIQSIKGNQNQHIFYDANGAIEMFAKSTQFIAMKVDGKGFEIRNNSRIIPTSSGAINFGDSTNLWNQIHANSFHGSGDFVELDVDGHTNLDNVSIAGVVTATSYIGDGSSLSNLPAGAPVGGASTNTVFFENDKAVAVNYQITSTKNAMSAGPIAINAGIAVTVPSGCAWTIV